MMNEKNKKQEKSESDDAIVVSRIQSKARGCVECRRLHRSCQIDRVGHACRRCIARFREGMCSLVVNNKNKSSTNSPSNSIATLSVDSVDSVSHHDDSVMDRLALLWLNDAFLSLKQQRRVDDKPRLDELVLPRICLRFDFVGELLIESVNNSALQLLLGDCDDDAGDDNLSNAKPREQIAGMAASRFMRCRTILATSYNLPTKVQSIDGECRMLQLNLPHGAGWTRVHCAGIVQLSQSPFDQRMWVRAMYMSILNVFAA